MTYIQFEIQLVAAVVAAACALLGVFLILRKMAMISDVISHAILPGIVLAFFVTNDLNSPLLIAAAALTGVVTVFLVELFKQTRLVKEDAAMGLVFPILFSIGVVLITQFAGDVHLDMDSVLLGELAFAPFDRLIVAGQDWGPVSLYTMLAILIVSGVFIALFYKELKITTFDSGLAATLGFMPLALHYGLMTLVSVTAVGAFDAVGSILVVALMIGPGAAAYLLTDRLSIMLVLSVCLGIVSAVAGYWLAHMMDASIAGSMALMMGLLFTVVLCFAPERGLVAVARLRKRQKWIFAQKMLTIHLRHHEGTAIEQSESREAHLHEHINWQPDFAREVVRRAERKGYIVKDNGILRLTTAGRALANEAVVSV